MYSENFAVPQYINLNIMKDTQNVKLNEYSN